MNAARQDIFVSWCATCGTPDVADATRKDPKRFTCGVCPQGEAFMRVDHYRLVPPVKRGAQKKRKAR